MSVSGFWLALPIQSTDTNLLFEQIYLTVYSPITTKHLQLTCKKTQHPLLYPLYKLYRVIPFIYNNNLQLPQLEMSLSVTLSHSPSTLSFSHFHSLVDQPRIRFISHWVIYPTVFVGDLWWHLEFKLWSVFICHWKLWNTKLTGG